MSVDDSHSGQSHRTRRHSHAISVLAGVVSGLVILTSVFLTVGELDVHVADAARRCRADQMTVEVAIEAFTATKNRLPESEAELVDAGFLRAESSMYDVQGSTVVAASGSPCADTSSLRTTGANGAELTVPEDGAGSGAADAARPPVCAAVDAAVERLDHVDGANAATLGSELHEIATMIRDAREPAPQPQLQADVVGLADVVSGMAVIVGLLNEHRPAADAETTIAIDDLVDGIAGYVRVIPTSEILTVIAPDLATTCGTGFVGAPELVTAVSKLDRTLTAFLATDLGHDPAFSMLVEVSENLGSPSEAPEPESSMVDEFEDCSNDLEATDLGDNKGCDALYHACTEGDMAACNDLFRVTFPGTDYSKIGASCGGRTQPLGRGYAGSCEEVEDE